ncbi:MAG: Ig-like domain-containing protein [Lachnospiraceae bacterium]|nr:Ig-like domain-containing protein [Lachnospiraceae bacterium]
MNRKLCVLLSVLILCVAGLAGCGSSGSSTSDSVSSSDGTLSKSEWVGMLGDKFGYDEYESTEDIFSDVSSSNSYYDQIQACAEWSILPETSQFQPDDSATWQYAIETSVRAIGIDKLNNSDVGVTVTEDNLVDFFTAYIANVDDSSLSLGLSETDAELILGYAYDYGMNLTLVEKVEYTYNEDVYETDANSITLDSDGVTATITDGSSYTEGDIIYVEPSEENAAYAIKVNSVNGDEITYETAGMEDVYEELQITGTFEGTVINVESAEGIEVSMAPGTPEQSFANVSYNENGGISATGVKVSGNSVTYTYNKDQVTFTAAVSDIKVTTDLDYGILSGLKKADVTVSFDDKISLEYTADHFGKTIPLGSVEVVLGSTPLTLELSLAVNIGMDGEASLVYTSTVVANVNYQKGSGLGKSVSNNDATCDFNAQVTVTAEPTIKAELRCFGRGIANVKVTSGVVAIATIDIDYLGDEPMCIDLYLYVPLRWAANEDGCIMTSISSKLKASKTVWDSETSQITMRFHWEDLVLVDACTRGTGEEIETDTVDEDGDPYDEYKLFDFEEIVFGIIKVTTQKVTLSVGESAVVGVLSLPDGYSTSDLVYSSDNTSVCTVSGTTVSAVGTGNTQIRISTSDGKFSASMAVVVTEEYIDTSGFNPL